jgi:cysteinyl-tRNA synthetase
VTYFLLRLFNTLSETKVEIDASVEFRMFVCGPTVQDNVHLGHAKTYLAFDVLARWLLKKGQKVFFILNITDIDDKIFDRAKKENVPYLEIANRFYTAFLEDLDALNIVTVSKYARVSKYVEESTSLVKQLTNSGKAYKLGGNVFFDTSKAYDFGKLSHQGPRELRLKQIDATPGKKNVVDFLLWRSITDETEGIWETSVGTGRPGWHIQDSAIAFEEMQGPYSLHGGATELIFPHHEAELAQDEAISNIVPFVKIWMHTGLLYKGQEKMSKSLGNVITVREALRSFTSDEIRFHFLLHHYREPLEYTPTALNASKLAFVKIREAALAVPKSQLKEKLPSKDRPEFVEKILSGFSASMDDDLDTPKAVSLLVDLSKNLLESADSSTKVEMGLAFWDLAETLGFKLY